MESHGTQRFIPRFFVAALAVLTIVATGEAGVADDKPAVPIRSKQIELHYLLKAPTARADVDLWYTRDRGATWTRFGADPDRRSPMIFVAPAEGLYGLMLIAREGTRVSRQPPQSGDTPQRWILVDDTPPLAQWEAVEPLAADAGITTVQLRWTAFDAHFTTRPVGLAYRRAGEDAWKSIDDALPNTGRFDWKAPEDLIEPVSFRLTVRDRGGHVVERIIGPMPVVTDRPAGASPGTGGQTAAASGDTTRPADPAPAARRPLMTETTLSLNPTETPAATQPVGADKQREAERLYRQGSWHLLRGEYGLAVQRFREALELDPEMPSTLNDLAGIYYLQKDYGRAIELYDRVLARDGKHREALRGAALAYVARKDYPASREMLGRLLAQDDRDAEAWLDLGDVVFLTGERADALRHWERAMTADPHAEAAVRKAKRRIELYGTTAGSGK